MAISNVVARGFGSFGGGVNKLPTRGFGIGAAVNPPIVVALTLNLTRAVSLSTPLSRSAALTLGLTRAVNLTLDSE